MLLSMPAGPAFAILFLSWSFFFSLSPSYLLFGIDLITRASFPSHLFHFPFLSSSSLFSLSPSPRALPLCLAPLLPLTPSAFHGALLKHTRRRFCLGILWRNLISQPDISPTFLCNNRFPQCSPGPYAYAFRFYFSLFFFFGQSRARTPALFFLPIWLTATATCELPPTKLTASYVFFFPLSY